MPKVLDLRKLIEETRRTGGRVLPGNAPVEVPGVGLVEFGMNEEIAQLSEQLAARNRERLPAEYAPVNPAFGRKLAEEFALASTKGDKESARAFKQLAKEVSEQYERARSLGYEHKFFPTVNGETVDPYGNPRFALVDINDNKRLYTYPTSSGYGSDPSVATDNPLLAASQFRTSDGQPMTVNDEFRFVHDIFGHAAPGAGFRAGGEENAFLWHAPTMSPIARRAATTELRGQNSTVNYGPHAGHNRTASSADTHYADQKAGLLPRWASELNRPTRRMDDFNRLLKEGRTGFEGAVDPQTGNLKLYHWAHKDLSRVDPAQQLTGLDRNNRSVRNRASDPEYPARAYFGLLNVPREYKPELGLGGRRHVAEIHGSQIYDIDRDAEKFKELVTGANPQERATRLERLIADANYSGYLRDDPALGKVAVVFDPLNAQRGAVDPKLLALLGLGAGAAGYSSTAEGMGLDVTEKAAAGDKPPRMQDEKDRQYPVQSRRLKKVSEALIRAADANPGVDVVTPARAWGELAEKYSRGEPRTYGDYFFANPFLYAVPAARAAGAIRSSRAGEIANNTLAGLLGIGIGARFAEGER